MLQGARTFVRLSTRLALPRITTLQTRQSHSLLALLAGLASLLAHQGARADSLYAANYGNGTSEKFTPAADSALFANTFLANREGWICEGSFKNPKWSMKSLLCHQLSSERDTSRIDGFRHTRSANAQKLPQRFFLDR